MHGNELTFLDLLRIVVRYWLTVLVAVTIGASLASFIAFSEVPIYRVEALLVTGREDTMESNITLGGSGRALASLAGINVGSTMASADEAIATLTSAAFITSFIEENSLLPKLFADRWSGESWTVPKNSDIPTAWEGYLKMTDDVLDVSLDRDSGLVSVRIDWREPIVAVHWIEMLIEKLNRHLRDRAIEQSEKSIAYLKQELDRTTVMELRGAIFGVMENQIKTIMLAKVKEEYSLRFVSRPIAPDPDHFVWPNRPLLISGGLLFGFFAGVCIAFFFSLYSTKTDGSAAK